MRLWVTPVELPGDYGTSPYAFEACSTATSILYAFSGRRFAGVTTVTEDYAAVCSTGTSRWLLRDETLRDLNQPSSHSCGCSGSRNHARLRLRGTPVVSIQRVSRGTEVVDPGTYRLVNRTSLEGASGTYFDTRRLTVTYTYGTRPPIGGVRAATDLAVEFIKSWDDKYSASECSLPDRVTSVSREGISYTILDDQSYLNEMRTGVYSVDLFLRAVNPSKAIKRARVFSAQSRAVSRVTGVEAPRVVGPNDLVAAADGSVSWTRSFDAVNAAGLAADGDAWTAMSQVTSVGGALIFDLTEYTTTDADAGTVSITAPAGVLSSLSSRCTLDMYAQGPDGFAHLFTATAWPTAS